MWAATASAQAARAQMEAGVADLEDIDTAQIYEEELRAAEEAAAREAADFDTQQIFEEELRAALPLATPRHLHRKSWLRPQRLHSSF